MGGREKERVNAEWGIQFFAWPGAHCKFALREKSEKTLSGKYYSKIV